MSKNKDLACSGYLEQASEARNTAENSPAGVDSDRENLAAFARRLGVNRSTVTRAAQAGRLVLAADGRVCIAASLARYHGTRGGRDDVAQRHAEARGHGVAGVAGGATWPGDARIGPQANDQEAGEGDVPAAGSRAAWEALKVRWQNAELLLALELESGARIPRQTVLQEAQGLGALLRATVERLVDQTAPRLAAAGASADRRRILAAEIATARRALLREFRSAARRLGPDGVAVRLAPVTDSQEAAA